MVDPQTLELIEGVGNSWRREVSEVPLCLTGREGLLLPEMFPREAKSLDLFWIPGGMSTNFPNRSRRTPGW